MQSTFSCLFTEFGCVNKLALDCLVPLLPSLATAHMHSTVPLVMWCCYCKYTQKNITYLKMSRNKAQQ